MPMRLSSPTDRRAIEGRTGIASGAPTLHLVALFVSLVLLIVTTRVFIETPNFAAAGAVAVFAGFVFRMRTLSLAAPFLGMLISDAVIGFYSASLMAGVYLALLTSVGLGRALARYRTPCTSTGSLARGFAAVLAGSVWFFISTNLMVWIGGSDGYARNFSGLLECYAAAVPFFRYTLSSDMLFSGVLFGSWSLIRYARPLVFSVRQPV